MPALNHRRLLRKVETIIKEVADRKARVVISEKKRGRLYDIVKKAVEKAVSEIGYQLEDKEPDIVFEVIKIKLHPRRLPYQPCGCFCYSCHDPRLYCRKAEVGIKAIDPRKNQITDIAHGQGKVSFFFLSLEKTAISKAFFKAAMDALIRLHT